MLYTHLKYRPSKGNVVQTIYRQEYGQVEHFKNVRL